MAKRVSLKGKGADLFFGADGAEPATLDVPDAPDAPDAIDPTPDHVSDTTLSGLPAASVTPNRSAAPTATTAPAPQIQSPVRQTTANGASKRASVLAPTPAGPDPLIIEQIRKTVKVPGKEVSFVRLTADEKSDLADIVYTYKRQGLKTSENEINRIAVNYMLADFHTNGEHSLLARVLAALRA